MEEDEKLKKRKERFGALTSGGAAGSADTEVGVLSSFITAQKNQSLTLSLFNVAGEEKEAR